MSDYISQTEAEAGIKTGLYFKGPFHISQRNYEQGYVYSPADDRDVLIQGGTNRNRAMPSDIVVVEIFEDPYCEYVYCMFINPISQCTTLFVLRTVFNANFVPEVVFIHTVYSR